MVVTSALAEKAALLIFTDMQSSINYKLPAGSHVSSNELLYIGYVSYIMLLYNWMILDIVMHGFSTF